MHKCLSFRASQEAELRTETLFGREYLVIPVVALVEGVLQGMNAATPELALASEFGKVPEGWNGRPVVMNHPSVNGVPVSANSPLVLEEFSFGTLFNTRLEDNKLKTEAWIDVVRAQELGGEFESTVTRLQTEGVAVEVSTGLFATSEAKEGKYKNKKYNAIWREVVPDHLAILSEGSKGACSVEDGCGAPRVNSRKLWQEYTMTNSQLKENCGCGQTGSACECDKANDPVNINGKKNADGTIGDEVVVTAGAENAELEALQRLTANALPNNILDSDIRTLLQGALRDENPRGYRYLIGFTTEKVVYEDFSENTGSWRFYQRSYDISDNVVTLADDAEEVSIMMQIVPKAKVVANGDGKVQPATQESTTMADNITDNKDASATPVADAAAAAAAVTANASEPAKVKTFAEYLAEMPSDMREHIQTGMRLHKEKKDSAIKALKESGRCQFADDDLSKMSLEYLENLVTLSGVTNYSGVATPTVNGDGSAASNLKDNAVPTPPKLFDFSAKKENAA